MIKKYTFFAVFLLCLPAFAGDMEFNYCHSPEGVNVVDEVIIQEFTEISEFVFNARVILPFTREVGSLVCGINESRTVVACSGGAGEGEGEITFRVRIYQASGESDIGVIAFGNEPYSIDDVLPLVCEWVNDEEDHDGNK